VEGPGQEAAVLAAATLAGPGDLDRWAGAAGAIMGTEWSPCFSVAWTGHFTHGAEARSA
jgi:hypothetical protein